MEIEIHLLADDDALGSAMLKQDHAGGKFGIAENRGTGHIAIPVPVGPPEGQHDIQRIAFAADQPNTGMIGKGHPEKCQEAAPERIENSQFRDPLVEVIVITV
jgi:hypothetical protein